jgi:cephalosporin hydroxylase
MSWDDYAIARGADKASSSHGYMGVYEKYLKGKKINRLLELGVAHGKSLFMWSDIFPDALIVGVDNNPECRIHQRSNIDILIADASDPAKMAAVSQLYGEFDVIIDDCDHIESQARLSLEELYFRMPSGGLYFIEDFDAETDFVKWLQSKWGAKVEMVDDKSGFVKNACVVVIEKP